MEELFNSEMDKIRDDLIAKHNELGMRASGDWERALKVIVSSTASSLKAVITGLDYTEYLVNGRAPGKFPPKDKIEQWIKDKGITPKDDISTAQLAFLIARKISLFGTNYYQQGGTDLVSSVITKERIRSIIDKLGGLLLREFTLEVNEKLK